ncbi:hypothetical protein [Fibrella aquatica]
MLKKRDLLVSPRRRANPAHFWTVLVRNRTGTFDENGLNKVEMTFSGIGI